VSEYFYVVIASARSKHGKFDHMRLLCHNFPFYTFQRQQDLSNLDKATALHLQRALQKTNGIVHGPGGAAAILGINPSTLRSKMKKLGIPYGRRRG